ncbi:tyrosine-type recombinase/integrase [Bartonella sp. TP]|uniref:tyrosine-type recombinase/integrase n=1 Tax=Bartonella sp. TP TaxID=3057550 RepID=UPI0025AFC539|nr:tyrosine-type recombinase/integrase [Bartonella sp. TP]WJW79972.1 tyrosine-type recombinase/integrase [Bartonella sp. TP]
MFLKALNGLFTWAVERELLLSNPCYGIKYPRLTNSDGFPAWSEEDVAKYYSYYRLGTRERVYLDVLLYTGLRRGDVVRIGYKNVSNNILIIKTEKSKYQTEVALPILPKLQQTLDAGIIGNYSFIASASGEPLTKESFGNMFRIACRKAGIEKSAHGVRKLSATRAANAGATVAELKAIFGWNDDEMASLYTKTANRRKLAAKAITKLNFE